MSLRNWGMVGIKYYQGSNDSMNGNMSEKKSEYFDKEDSNVDDSVFPNIVNKLRGAGCVFAEEEAKMLISAAANNAELMSMVESRISGLPIEHVIGWANFCGIKIEVDPGVFVPRQRSEFLVHQTIEFLQPGATVVDLCCGSAAIGVAVASSIKDIKLYATDIDPIAVKCARRNVVKVGGKVFEGDLFDPLPKVLHGNVDILVANAPYVPTESLKFLPPEARIHEARMALDGGKDGLDVQRRVASEANFWLVSGGHLLIETSERQASMTAEIFSEYGLIPKIMRYEELDATVVIGNKEKD